MVHIPLNDGEISHYNLSNSAAYLPIIYYVNGIRVAGVDHAKIASLLSLLTEFPIRGVYNKTSGAIADFGQCLLDYSQNAGARLFSSGLTPAKNISDRDLPAEINKLINGAIVWNKATASLFEQLALNRSKRQMIIAHSQGNLITSNALFVLESFLGSRSLENIRVYSLASPSPGWPLGLRYTNGGGGRQENAFMNDLVALLRPHNLAAKAGITQFQNAGDFRTHPGGGAVGIAAHDTVLNIALNFLQSIRNDLGFTKPIDQNFLDNCRKQAATHFPEVNS
jgi:hypothetical protein